MERGDRPDRPVFDIEYFAPSGKKSEMEWLRTKVLFIFTKYGIVTVGDVKSLQGYNSSFKDELYGWTKQISCDVIKRDGKWILELGPLRVL